MPYCKLPFAGGGGRVKKRKGGDKVYINRSLNKRLKAIQNEDDVLQAYNQAKSQQERDLIVDKYLSIYGDNSDRNVKNRYEYPYLTARNYEYRQQKEVYIIDDDKHDFSNSGQVYITAVSDSSPDC